MGLDAEGDLMAEIQGHCEPGYEAVRAAFIKNFEVDRVRVRVVLGCST